MSVKKYEAKRVRVDNWYANAISAVRRAFVASVVFVVKEEIMNGTRIIG